MIAARESISEFIKAKVASDLTGLTSPEMRFAVRSSQQPPEFPNCLNIYFFDDLNAGNRKFNPHVRTLTSSLELLVMIDPNNPLTSERDAYQVIHLINQFMAVQRCDKKDYSQNPVVNLGTQISWHESYPLEWISVPNENERYIHKTCSINFLYAEEKVVA